MLEAMQTHLQQPEKTAMRRKFDIWKVAYAVVKFRGRLHINALITEIELSELTTLGLKGKTPKQTVNPIVRNLSRSCYFIVDYCGFVSLKSPNAIVWQAAEACRAYASLQ
jgi:hypothetical protein